MLPFSSPPRSCSWRAPPPEELASPLIPSPAPQSAQIPPSSLPAPFTQPEWVALPLGPSLSVPLPHLLLAMQRHLDQDDRSSWDPFVAHLRLVVTHYHGTLVHTIADALHCQSESIPERRMYRALLPLLAHAGFGPVSVAHFPSDASCFDAPAGSPDWGSMGSEALQDVGAKAGLYPPKTVQPIFAPHAFLFARGATSVSRSGRFLGAKVRLLWDILTSGGPSLLAQLTEASEAPSPPPPADHFRVVRRQTLLSHLRNSGIASWIFADLTIEEPAYENVVVCYPTTGSSPAVHLDLYGSTTQADLPALLPTKQGSQWAAASWVISALVAASVALFLGLVPLVVVVLTCAFTSRASVGRSSDNWRREQRIGTQAGAAAVLGLDASDETTKRLLVAYFTLWRHGPHTSEGLGRAVSLFLRDEFDLEGAFDARDTVAQLVRLGLANVTETKGRTEIAASGTPRHILPQFDGLQILHAVHLA